MQLSRDPLTLLFGRAQGTLPERSKLRALGHIPYHRDHEILLPRAAGAQADLDRKCTAVLTPTREYESGSHGSRFRVAVEAVTVPGVGATVSLRHQNLDRLPHQRF